MSSMATMMTVDEAIEAGLDQSDRCDRCPAQAQVRWVRGDQSILTCAHHARAHEVALLEWAHFSVDNRRDRFVNDDRR